MSISIKLEPLDFETSDDASTEEEDRSWAGATEEYLQKKIKLEVSEDSQEEIMEGRNNRTIRRSNNDIESQEFNLTDDKNDENSVQRYKAYLVRCHQEAKRVQIRNMRCSKCGAGSKSWADLRWHLHSHLGKPLYACCNTVVRDIWAHHREIHGQKLSGEPLIRSELAEEATENFFACFPQLVFLQQQSLDEMRAAKLQTIAAKESEEEEERITDPEEIKLCEMRAKYYELTQQSIVEQLSRQESVQCGKCSKDIPTTEGPNRIFRHIERHIKIKPYKCPHCPKTESNLKRHFRLKHTDEDRFSWKPRIRVEAIKEALENQAECLPTSTSARIVSEQKMKDFVLRHEENLPPHCPEAKIKTLEQRKNLEAASTYYSLIKPQIMAEIRQKKEIACGKCDQQIADLQPIQLFRHIEGHMRKKPYQCLYCPNTILSYFSHLRSCHKEVTRSDRKPKVRLEAVEEAMINIQKCLPTIRSAKVPNDQEIQHLISSSDSNVADNYERNNLFTEFERTKKQQRQKDYVQYYRISVLRLKKELNETTENHSCGKCGSEFTNCGFFSDIVPHVQSHLSRKPYSCEFCPMKVYQYGRHCRRYHNKHVTELNPTIRLEVAEEAMKNLIECFPTQNSSKLPTSEELREILASGLQIEEDVVITTEELKVLGRKVEYYEIVKAAAIKELKRRHSRNETTSCGKCKGEEFLSHLKPEKLKNHILSHLTREPYKCEHCPSNFLWYTSHMRNIHPDKDRLSTKPKIRPIVVDEAIENLEKCLPFLKLLRNSNEIDKFLTTNHGLSEKPKAPAINAIAKPKPTDNDLILLQKKVDYYQQITRKVFQELNNTGREKDRNEAVCAKCNNEFSKNNKFGFKEMVSHIHLHLEPKLYQCPFCPATLNHYAEHVRKSHPDRKQLPTKPRIRPEIVDLVVENLQQCFPLLESSKLRNSDEIEIYLKTNHCPEEIIRENLSAKEVTKLERKAEYYELNKKRITGELRLLKKAPTCGKCSFQLTTECCKIFQHIETHMLIRPYQCNICSKKMVYIKSHLRLNHNVRSAQKFQVRIEAVEEALKNVEECFPECKSAKQPNEEEIMSICNAPVQFTPTFEVIEDANERGRKKEAVDFYRIAVVELSRELKNLPTDQTKCGVCNYELTRTGFFSQILPHVHTHLSNKPYQCQLCTKKIYTYRIHMLKYHMEENCSERNPKIRPEIVDEALNNLYLCFPTLKAARKQTREKMKEILGKLKEGKPTTALFAASYGKEAKDEAQKNQLQPEKSKFDMKRDELRQMKTKRIGLGKKNVQRNQEERQTNCNLEKDFRKRQSETPLPQTVKHIKVENEAL